MKMQDGPAKADRDYGQADRQAAVRVAYKNGLGNRVTALCWPTTVTDEHYNRANCAN